MALQKRKMSLNMKILVVNGKKPAVSRKRKAPWCNEKAPMTWPVAAQAVCLMSEKGKSLLLKNAPTS